jgi:hypothetical protein
MTDRAHYTCPECGEEIGAEYASGDETFGPRVEAHKRIHSPIDICVYLNGSLVWSMPAPPAYAMGRLRSEGHVGVSSLAAGLRRAVEDAEAIRAGRDPERPSERAIRLAEEERRHQAASQPS